MKSNRVEFDLLLMIDDGSPMIAGLHEFSFLATIDDTPSGRYGIFRFTQSLGRQARVVYPGWFRSFAWAALYAERHGFDKVIHIESDAYVVSWKGADWINGITEGWHAPFCSHIRQPESAIRSSLAPR